MEHLDGKDLAAWVKEKGALPIEQAVEFVLHACVAVADAHALGIIHRDLKPANLFCVTRSDGQLSIKVLDFGISKVTAPSGANAALGMTKTNAVMGSPLYMSPEQMQSTKAVDVRTDIWALGVVLYELIAGRAPFLSDSLMELGVKIATEVPPALRSSRPEVSAELERVIFKCLEKDARRRYGNVGELALALLPFAPMRARASVDRISGILQAGGLSASALTATASQLAGPTPTFGGTLPAVGWTTSGARRRKSLARRIGFVALATFAGGTALLLLGRTRAHHDEAQTPTNLSAAAVTASPAASSPPVPSAAARNATDPTEPAAPVSTASSPAREAPMAVAPEAEALTGRQPAREHAKPGKMAKPPPAASPNAAAPNAAAPDAAAPAPTCNVVADYDSEGQPHFRKVCK